MKIVVTGSLGHISKPLTNELVQKGHTVTVISNIKSEELARKGLPIVQYIAEKLSTSPNYLSGLLRMLTGQTTQQHIHNKLIERAKEKLCTTDLSVTEIAYELGFEHLQSFSKLFKTKTGCPPLEFRQSFN